VVPGGHAHYTGVEIVRPVKDGPTTVGHEPVTGAQLLMHLLRSAGWVVRLREPVATFTGGPPPRTGDLAHKKRPSPQHPAGHPH
jgi:hypothetical protein